MQRPQVERRISQHGFDTVRNAERVSGARALWAVWLLLLLCLMPVLAAAAVDIKAVRVWPATEYTRITIESTQPIEYTVFTMGAPQRLVLDLEGVHSPSTLENLPQRIAGDDPHIAQARLGRPRPGVARVVLELKTSVRPQAFALKPIGQYAHRLVLDLYPEHSVDPLMALVNERETMARTDDAKAAIEPPSVSPREGSREAPSKADADAKLENAPVTGGKNPKRRQKSGSEIVRLLTIAIDAGHGGEDPGARGRRGTHEKNVTLAIARKLKRMVDQQPGMRAALIRDGDYFVSLYDRVSKARKVRADLFVSIHADAFVKPHARGSSVFALSQRGATSAAARWLATKEKEADLIGGINLGEKDSDVREILLDLSQDRTMSDSMSLARAVLSEIDDINILHKPRVERAGFAVLKAPDIPSILVETAFISNPHEEKKLRSPQYQEKMARAILAGVKRYFAANPPMARSKLAQSF